VVRKTLCGSPAGNFAGKVVIDAINPLVFPPNHQIAVGHKDSAGEQVQRWLPSARVLRAFNIVGHAHMFNRSLRFTATGATVRSSPSTTSSVPGSNT
jgi:predicted dinucleotide-binding enzyme